MRNVLLAAAMILAMPAWSSAASLVLDCKNAAMGSLDEKVAEARLLRETQGKATRVSVHLLLVKAAGRVLEFRDVPSNEALMDVHYAFCGSRDGYSLVGWANGDVFTGKLIDEKSAQVSPGGLRVIFSPDRQAYLTVEQEDGMDGEDWTVHYANDGKASWKGHSFFRSKSASIELDDPRWTDNGELIASAVRWDKPDAIARLVKVGRTWSWRVAESYRANKQ
ncbi:hypothetical protein WJ33_26095 [Burkholderia ubonensis]|uniref:Uncharacterized protein n=1 Tax=Burkholderia ubonensis TaxID=101571 RepID=A0A124RB73_9BURK|nr:hypothetical protein [Burkholderia ubonensis]KVG66829.1 hypothetical protein WJ33_26095 [Burkholderia ubonensis]